MTAKTSDGCCAVSPRPAGAADFRRHDLHDSARAPTKFAQACSDFTTVALQPDKMIVRMIDNNGALLYTAAIPRAQA